MSKIKEAYDALMQAIQEETGAVASIDIYIFRQGDNAYKIAERLTDALSMDEYRYLDSSQCHLLCKNTNKHPHLDVGVFE